MKGFLKFFGIVLLFCVFIYAIVFIRPYRVSGDSMEPTMDNNSIILIDRLFPKIFSFTRGDIVVYNHNSEVKIKRILGLSGETIRIGDGKIYTESSLVVERYLNPHFRTCVPGSCIDLSEKIYQVPVNQYFVLGDNRENSRDSRGCLDALSCSEEAIYFVPKSDIIGKHIFALPSL